MTLNAESLLTRANGHSDPQFGHRENMVSNTYVDKSPTYPIEILNALLAAQKIAKPVEKDSKNAHHGYKYASAENIIEESRKYLHDQGLGVMAASWSRTSGSFMRVRYVLFHTSGATSEFVCETSIVPEKGRPEDKAEATALTYNWAYFLRGLLMLARVEEGTDVDQRKDSQHESPKEPEYSRYLKVFLNKVDATKTQEELIELAKLVNGKHAEKEMTDSEHAIFKAIWLKRSMALK